MKTMKKVVIHKRSLPAFNHLGKKVAVCMYAKNHGDLKESKVQTRTEWAEVTCTHCLRFKAKAMTATAGGHNFV